MSEISGSLASLDPLSFVQHLDRAPEASLIVDERGVILWANRAAIDLFGYADHNLNGRLVEELIPERLRVLHQLYRQRFGSAPEAQPANGRRASFPAQRADGSVFEAEISLSPVEHGGQWTTLAVVRDISDHLTSQWETDRRVREAETAAKTERERREAFLAFLGDIRLSVLSEEPVQDVLSLVLSFAQDTLGCAHSLIALPTTGGLLKIQATLTNRMGDVGDVLPEGSMESRAYGEATRIVVSEEAHKRGLGPVSMHQLSDIGSMVVSPLLSRGNPLGVLVAGRKAGSPSFTGTELVMIDALSRESAVALELYAAAGERRRLLLVEDRERIGRELQDRVLQRLFAIGMSLQAGLTEQAAMASRVESAVNDIDDVIATVRDSIFRLGAGS